MRSCRNTLPNESSSVARPANSWAAVAATASPIEQDTVVKYRPSDAVKLSMSESEPTGKDSQDQRVVWVAPWPKHRAHTDITKAIEGLGALFSIAYSPEAHGICIIFQHASTAYQFLQYDAEHVASTGHSRFGLEVGVQLGALYPANSDIKRMDNPNNERRRLTFARQQLFSNGLTEDIFRRDIESLVGTVYVELLWLFNTGNGKHLLYIRDMSLTSCSYCGFFGCPASATRSRRLSSLCSRPTVALLRNNGLLLARPLRATTPPRDADARTSSFDWEWEHQYEWQWERQGVSK